MRVSAAQPVYAAEVSAIRFTSERGSRPIAHSVVIPHLVVVRVARASGLATPGLHLVLHSGQRAGRANTPTVHSNNGGNAVQLCPWIKCVR